VAAFLAALQSPAVQERLATLGFRTEQQPA
jgi:hypothetical protein